MSLEDAGEWGRKWGPLIAVVGMIIGLIINAIKAFGWSWTVAGFLVIALLGFILGYLVRYWTAPSPSPPLESKPDPKPAASTQPEPAPEPRPEPEPKPRREPDRIPLTLPPRPKDRRKKPPAQAKPSSPEVYKALGNLLRDRAICPKGPHTVKAGEALPIELDVRPEDHVLGALREVSGQRLLFDYYICDRKERLRFEGGIVPNAVRQGFDEHTHSVDFKVPSTPLEPWYLILSVETKQLPRKIEAVLEWVND